ncbi:MAG: methylated-DNA--[protein]-cysteine S-methyltransferase [Planctomycetes bacterium]|nr:methylated-DNA--[protein]-cysteine S-methyltransferase [Planctomycetota bacterium]
MSPPADAAARVRYGVARTRLGPVHVAATPRGVCRICLPGGGDALLALRRECAERAGRPLLVEDAAAVRDVLQQIEAYVEGEGTRFRIRLDVRGTEFQLRVWAALQRIPYGVTRTYAEVASDMGAPRACRAVGAANGRNPAPLVVPCHRVVGRDGLGGFTGSLDVKRALLALERARGFS